MVLSHRSLNKLWDVVVVYGPANHSQSQLFLDEISLKVASSNLPLLIGCDFNLLRSPSNKNNSNFSWARANAFNDIINNATLRELNRVGARFTLSNHQISPIRSVLDRVFMCPEWDHLFPRSSLVDDAHIGSDHTPLLLDSGELSIRVKSRFYFDSFWCLVDGFVALIRGKISSFLSSNPRSFGPMDDWHFCSQNLHKFLKGWNANRTAAARREKNCLTDQIKSLDWAADSVGLSQSRWAQRYALEAALMDIHHQEELYWQHHSRFSWTLKGDALTAYFFCYC